MNHRSLTTALAIAIAAVAACSATVPKTSYYRLNGPTEPSKNDAATADAGVMFIDELSVDAAYDNQQIAYREGPYKLDYYNYHRWSAPPGVLVSDFLRSAYASTGEFRRVVREFDDEADVTLTGRVLSLEEVDKTRERWVASIGLELELHDTDTGEVLWTTRVTEEQPLSERNPEGLARAVSQALQRVVERTAPEIAAAAAKSDGDGQVTVAGGR